MTISQAFDEVQPAPTPRSPSTHEETFLEETEVSCSRRYPTRTPGYGSSIFVSPNPRLQTPAPEARAPGAFGFAGSRTRIADTVPTPTLRTTRVLPRSRHSMKPASPTSFQMTRPGNIQVLLEHRGSDRAQCQTTGRRRHPLCLQTLNPQFVSYKF